MSKVEKIILITFHVFILLYTLLMTVLQILAFHFDGLLGTFPSLSSQIVAATATFIGTCFVWWFTAAWFIKIEK
jgi:hypothetical protein